MHMIFYNLVYKIFVGIGRELVKGLVESGADVVAISRTQSDLDSLKENVRIKIIHIELNDFCTIVS